MTFDVHFAENTTASILDESSVSQESPHPTLIIPMSTASSTQSTNFQTPLSSNGSSTSSSSSVSESYLLSGDLEVRKRIATSVIPDAKLVKSVKRPRQNRFPADSDALSPPSNEDDSGCFRSHYKLRVRKSTQSIDTPPLYYKSTPISVFKMLQPTKILPIWHFAQRFGVLAPDYEHVLENDYSSLEEQWRREDPESAASQSAANLRRRESRLWVCDCSPPSAEEFAEGRLACGQGCINRALYIECANRRCPASGMCSNRQFQLRLYALTEPYYCGPEKGWGLRAFTHIPKGTFIVEYVGEVIDFSEFRKRIRLYENAKRAHHYFMSLGPEHFIDAGTKGNWARFVNHSCEPNAETQKWTVNGQLRIGFFTKCDIEAMEEITIDYQFVQYGVTEQKCYCGTLSCSGIMGSSSKQLQDKVRLKDTRAVERRILQLLASKSLRNAEDVTFLLQVMVQEYLTRYTRLELLTLLVDTDNETYLKLFRQYNGLELLTSFMCDSATNDWQLKHRILISLDHIPVSEQQQVRTDSNLMEIVRQWTIDPSFCRPRANTTVNTPPFTVDSENDDDDYDDVELDIDESAKRPENGKQKMSSSEILLQSNAVQIQSETKSVDLDIEPVNGDTVIEPIPTQIFSNDVSGKNTSEKPTESKEDEEEEKSERRITQLELANAVKVYSTVEEHMIIRRIRKLASRILKRWSALPFETYRIPRREREETEQSIMRTAEPSSSALESWGTSSNENNFTSWNLISKSSSSSGRSTGSPMTVRASNSESRKNRQDVSRELRRTKHRKQFEADMQAAESAATSLLSTAIVPSSSTSATTVGGDYFDKAIVAESVRSLLFKTLARQLSIGSVKLGQANTVYDGEKNGNNAALSLQETMSLLSGKLCEFAKKQDTQGLLAYLQTLTDDTKFLSTSSVASELNEENKLSNLLGSIPPPWCAAIDPKSGRTYYYNSVTKAVQWHHPASPNSNATVNGHSSSHKSSKKKDFISETYACILKLLRPFRLPNCLTGRIDNDEDMKYLAKRFAFALSEREMRRSQSVQPHVNSTMVERFRRKIVHYMTSRGSVYVRSKGKEDEENETLKHDPKVRNLTVEENNGIVETDDDCDMEIDETEL